MAIDADDGVAFDQASLTATKIREELDYGGVRLRATASLSGARISPHYRHRIRRFGRTGDWKQSIIRRYSTCLAPNLALTHPRPLLPRNSRQWLLSVAPTAFAFDEQRLARAFAATFARRQTQLTTKIPDALTLAFAQDPAKRLWGAFAADLIEAPRELGQVTAEISDFLMAAARAARGGSGRPNHKVTTRIKTDRRLPR